MRHSEGLCLSVALSPRGQYYVMIMDIYVTVRLVFSLLGTYLYSLLID